VYIAIGEKHMDAKEIEKILETDSLLDHLRRYYGKASAEYKRRYAERYAELATQPKLKTSKELREQEREADEEDKRIVQGY
jgi:hypothetical protein